jgi:hypothetical protein
MLYEFTKQQLEQVFVVWEINKEFGPVAAYRWFHKLKDNDKVETGDVEDFAISFMSQYNAQFGRTF